MAVRVLPEFLINQIAAGEVVERPASVVKELVENALDAGADQIMVDVVDGGRTMICVVDNGGGMSREDLEKSVTRHATSKLPDDDLLNISFMGFRGEALPSIASVSDMTIDTCQSGGPHGWRLDVNTMDVRPSDWDVGTRIRVENLFGKTPARLKFLRGDRAEMMSVLEVVKRLAMSRPDVGFVLNNKWHFPKNQDLEQRIADVMGDDVRGRMLDIDAVSASDNTMRLHGFISQPTLRRASSVDQYLFVNGRPVKDKVLVGALRAAYMDVMHAREFPLCALYLTLNPRYVDVNVSPAKTEVHFLEPSHVRAFIVKTLRERLAKTMTGAGGASGAGPASSAVHASPVATDLHMDFGLRTTAAVTSRDFVPAPDTAFVPVRPAPSVMRVAQPGAPDKGAVVPAAKPVPVATIIQAQTVAADDGILGRVIGQFGNKYILAQRGTDLIVIDQHAAHERITYERMRHRTIKVQPLLSPIVVHLRAEDVMAIESVTSDLADAGLNVEGFGDDAVAIFAKPADWDLDWAAVLHAIADEVRVNGASSQLGERLHLKLANYACHHSVRAGQKLDMAQMTALLREIEETERAGQCNHGRPVYKVFSMSEIDTWFERI